MPDPCPLGVKAIHLLPSEHLRKEFRCFVTWELKVRDLTYVQVSQAAVCMHREINPDITVILGL